jgi:hypothetical protein
MSTNVQQRKDKSKKSIKSPPKEPKTKKHESNSKDSSNTLSKKSVLIIVLIVAIGLFGVVIVFGRDMQTFFRNNFSTNYKQSDSDDEDTQVEKVNQSQDVDKKSRDLRSQGEDSQINSSSVVYVTISGHIEDGKYYADCNKYPEYRQKLLDFAEIIKKYEVPFNLQLDMEFLVGVDNCSTKQMRDQTDGKNVINYLVDKYDFEIDPHKGGGWEEPGENNYADVHLQASKVTEHVTDTAGGVVWDQVEQFERFVNGEKGVENPNYVWEPKILTMGVHTKHHLSDFSLDDNTGGVWQPKGFGDDFWTHDPDAEFIYIGPGMHHLDWFGGRDCRFEYVADYIKVLYKYIEKQRLPADKMYTVTLPVPQKIIFNSDNHQLLEDQIQAIQSLSKAQGYKFVHYTEAAEIWKDSFYSNPNIVTIDEIDESDYTCE